MSTKAAQCWYSAEDYEEIRAAMDDGHLLPKMHAHWLEGAEQREDQASRKGAEVFRVPFDLSEFQRFCSHFKVRLNADARAKFAALKIASKEDDNRH